MKIELHFLDLVRLAKERGADRKSFKDIEETDAICSQSDIDDDLGLLLERLPQCRYVPSGFGLQALLNAYQVGMS